MLNNQEISAPVLIEDLGMRYTKPTSLQKRRYGLYKCSCGAEFECVIQSVKYGYTQSCGCYNKLKTKERTVTHSLSYHRLYPTWDAMIRRCFNIKNHKYESYGGRGITVCDRWKDINNFIEDMYPSFKEGLTLDRRDNDGNYEPSNCRWSTKTIQSQNIKRIRKNNSSGYKGVFFNTQKDKYQAKIQIQRVQKHLGFFDNPRTAALAYDRYVIENDFEHTKNFS